MSAAVMERSAALGTGERSEHGTGAAGLVPYKTTLGASLVPGGELIISLGASAIAEKRVARLKRAVWASGHLHKLADQGKGAPVCWFVTLTYAKADAWAADHISFAIQQFRKFCMRHKVKCRYTWVAEIQPKRLERTGQAVVHYHLLAWLPIGLRMPQWDRVGTDKRPTWWPHGMTKTEVAKSGVGYLMKYLSKLGEFHRFPKGLRLYGVGGLDASGKSVRGWLNLPEWCKALHGVGSVKRHAGRLVVLGSGEVLASPYTVRRVPGALIVRLVGTVVPRWFAGAYSELRVAA